MSRMESAVPAAAAELFDAPMAAGDSAERAPGSMAGNMTAKLGSLRRVVGLVLLGVTIFLWTATNFLASVCHALSQIEDGRS